MYWYTVYLCKSSCACQLISINENDDNDDVIQPTLCTVSCYIQQKFSALSASSAGMPFLLISSSKNGIPIVICPSEGNADAAAFT